MDILEIKKQDISQDMLSYFEQTGYVCVDTETTGLDYMNDMLCTIQLYAEEKGIIIRYDKTTDYTNLINLFLSENILKIFHNAVFDVCFLMNNLNLNNFGKVVCTRIASKIIHGLKHNNSLKPLLQEYLGIEISKKEQLSDWSVENLSNEQKIYAINDVKYLKPLWDKLHEKLIEQGNEKMASICFEFVSNYKRLMDRGIENIFKY